MREKIKYPVGMQSFSEVRKTGRLYIDKTQYIVKLRDFGKYFFLGRPRRFGKSLFLSMLESFFKGHQELFIGLRISEWESEWKKYPVVHLDLSKVSSSDGVPLNLKLAERLVSIGAEYGVPIPSAGTLDGMVDDLLRGLKAKTGRNVVVLIDEYDVPIQGVRKGTEEFASKRDALRSLFLQIKGGDEYIEFCMVTGVARFNQVSLFSAPNNFDDISMHPEFAAICGFTHDELREYCIAGIENFADKCGCSCETVMTRLADHYDGYRFTELAERVFSPMSVMYALRDCKFDNHWIRTGMTSAFVRELVKPEFRLPNLTEEWVDAESLCKIYDAEDPLSLMFQTGYMTISDYDDGYYRLRVPNREVMEALTKDLIPAYMGREEEDFPKTYRELRLALLNGDVAKMLEIVSSVLDSVAYHLYPKAGESADEKERFYHSLVYFVFMLVSSNVVCEMPSAHGRKDLTAWTDKYVYIFEFKMDDAVDGDAESALRQIEEENYGGRFRYDGRTVYGIGLVFSARERRIAESKIMQLV